MYNLSEMFLLSVLKHLIQANWPNEQEESSDSRAIALYVH